MHWILWLAPLLFASSASAQETGRPERPDIDGRVLDGSAEPLEGEIAAFVPGLNALMEPGESVRLATSTKELIQTVVGRRSQALGGIEPRPNQAASRLFVSCRDGSLSWVELMAGLPDKRVASLDLEEPLRFLAHHPTRPIVYALGDEHLMAVEWNAEESTFAVLGEAQVGLRGTHVALDPSARWALVASYGGGAISCLPISAEGLPQPSVSRLGGADDPRLTKAHQVRWHPGGELAYVPALGADQVALIRVEPKTGALEWAGAAAVDAGTGPRHMALHPTEPWAYALGEHTSTITSFTLDEEGASWSPLGQVSNLPEGFEGSGSASSDIQISRDGRFLFAVNREPANDLTAYAIGREGALTEVSRISTGGVHARTFAQGPVGDRLWIGNTRSKNVFTLSVALDGTLGIARGEWEAPGEITCVLAR